MSNERPIDEVQVIPAPSGKNEDYLTRDIEVDLENEVRKLIDLEQRLAGVGRRQAAQNIIERLKTLGRLLTP